VNYDITDAFHIKKTIRGKCDTSGMEYSFKSHNNPVLGTQVDSEINATISVTRDAGVVDEVDVFETHLVRVNTKREVGAKVQASQTFKLQGMSTFILKDFRVLKSIFIQYEFDLQTQVPQALFLRQPALMQLSKK